MRIRAATPTDREACYAICVATAADGHSAAALHRYPDLLGDVYVGPYLALETDRCFVLVDHGGHVVGYVLGAPDTSAFAMRAERSWWPLIRDRTGSCIDPTPSDAALLALIDEPAFAPPGVVEQFPAHGHIDLLPAAQGRGMGRALMSTLEESLRSAGAPAMHLGVSATNASALGFYARLGFAEISRDDDTVFVGKRL